ncbi:hypothetical protein [Methylomicrobium lacus]|uniref:hypothetical protein n=1 Tax=Methylomicrobium lacus TaxID=136992 RepID=UPI0035A90B08
MTEGLFILTVIFAAYVVYQVVNDKKAGANPSGGEARPAADPAVSPQPQAAIKQAAAPAAKPQAAAKSAAAPAPKPAARQQAAAAAPKPAEAAAKSGLKNPETGEVTAAFTNYRFAKRWIKEALVAEGLLDKVYKNNELDADTEAKIKDAVAKLEALPKYRA